jgi:dihydrolipoamide dehydrogenase
MERTIDIAVPDIGDFKDVEIVEVLVESGDVVAAEQALLTVESDKATMEIPSPVSGTIVSVLLKVGDKVSRGAVIAKVTLESSAAPPASSETMVRTDAVGGHENARALERYDLIVIGGGPGGYSAAYRAADLDLKTAIIERYETLGGVCLNVGCIPSKALLHIAAVKEEAERIADQGVRFGAPEIDLQALRSFKDATVKRLTDGLKQMARARKVTVIRGSARFVSTNQLEIVDEGRAIRHVEFDKCIVATGSSAVEMGVFPEDERIVTSTGALMLRNIPKRMLVVGAGIIGLEMATVYSALGATIDVVERSPELLFGIDPDAVKIWRSRNAHRFEHIDLGRSVTSVTADPHGISVQVDGAATAPRSYDLVLQSVGRIPNSFGLGLEAIGVVPNASGFVTVDKQMRTNVPHVFAIGDVAGGQMLAHKAVHEGHVAAEAAAGLKSFFDAKVVPNVAYTDPEIAWVGVMEHDAAVPGKPIRSAKFPWAASGRAIASGASYGMTKLIFEANTQRIVGGVIVGPHAGDMIGEICLAIEMGADAIDIGKIIHPHPTLGETIGMSAEVYEGVCTDLLPTAKSSRGG